MDIPTLERQPSLVEGVCTRLSDIIRNEQTRGDGWLPPERELAEKLGVSRPVVREATKRLEMQGLLEVQHGVGTRVVDKLHKPLNSSLALLIPDIKERLRQLTEVRLSLEPENARLAAIRASASQIKELRHILSRHQAAQNIEDSAAADMEFHRSIAIASGNQISALLIHSLSELMQASLLRGYRRVTAARALEDHERILLAIETRDEDASAQAMKQHLINARADHGFEMKKPSRSKSA